MTPSADRDPGFGGEVRRGRRAGWSWGSRGRLILLPPLALFLLLTSWAVASPVGSSSDDEYHLASIWCAWGDGPLCEIPAVGGYAEVSRSLTRASCFLGGWPNVVEGAACTREVGTEKERTYRVSLGSRSTVFYRTMGTFAGTDVSLSVVMMRLANAALAAIMLLWALSIAPFTVARALALAWGAAVVPVGAFVLASSHPSAWAVIGLGTYATFFVAAWVRGQQGWRSALPAVVGATASAVLAASARIDAWVGLLLVSALVWVLLAGRSGHLSLTRTGLSAAGVIAALGLGGLLISMTESRIRLGQLFTLVPQPWSDEGRAFLRGTGIPLLLEYPAVAFGIVGGQEPSWGPGMSRDSSGYVGDAVPVFRFGAAASEFEFPSATGLLLGVAVAFLLITGIGSASRRRLLVLALAAAAWVAYVWTSFGANITSVLQPRYFLPLGLAVLGLFLLRYTGRRPLLSPAQAWVLAGLVTVGGAAAWLATATRYAVSPSARYTDLGQPVTWWWTTGPGMTEWFVIALLATVGWTIATLVLWGTARPAAFGEASGSPADLASARLLR